MTTLPFPTTDKAISELEAKIEALENELEPLKVLLQRGYEHRKSGHVRQINDLITSFGLTVDDVTSLKLVEMAIKQAVKGTAKAPSTSTKGNTSEYVAPPAKWCNPADPSQTYGGGRGKKPNWLIEALAAGKTMDDLLIKKPA